MRLIPSISEILLSIFKKFPFRVLSASFHSIQFFLKKEISFLIHIHSKSAILTLSIIYVIAWEWDSTTSALIYAQEWDSKCQYEYKYCCKCMVCILLKLTAVYNKKKEEKENIQH